MGIRISLPEHTFVEIVGDHDLAGWFGSIVHVYNGGEAYEVEFSAEPENFLRTIYAENVVDCSAMIAPITDLTYD